MHADKAFVTVPNGPKPGKKYFSLAEANMALVYVDKVVDDIVQRYKQAVDIRQRIERPSAEDSIERLRDDYEIYMDQLNEYIDELALAGVELKDFERGLIDFPALHQGREVCLCWQRGEEAIQAWHEVDTGFAGRRDVALLHDDSA